MEGLSFSYDALPARVLFGLNTLDRVSEEVARLGAHRALVLCTPRRRAEAQRVVDRLGSHAAGLFDGAAMHVPAEVAEHARTHAGRANADCIVAFGGGSTIGLAKAIALETRTPIVAIPTTYAGSEMTPIYGITDRGVKKTGAAEQVLPKTVLYDPLLTTGLSVSTSITSGVNAIAHAAEGLYAREANPITRLMAEEGIRALVASLPRIYRDARDLEARSDALYGAWLCGTVLGHGGMSLHHKLCHTLGGSFGLPHAEVHTVILPHALAYNHRHASSAMRRMSRAMSGAEPARFVHTFAADNGAPTSLRQLGFKESDIERAVDLALANPYWSPRPLERAAITHLMRRAFTGEPPQIDEAQP